LQRWWVAEGWAEDLSWNNIDCVLLINIFLWVEDLSWNNIDCVVLINILVLVQGINISK